MNDVQPDEVVYTDYKDAARTMKTNIKFKTTTERIRFWVAAHKEIYNNRDYYEFGQNLITLKHKDSSNRNLIVKFHLTTGVVLVQGSRYIEWTTTLYDKLKSRVNELCGECDDEHEATSDTDDTTTVKVRQYKNDITSDGDKSADDSVDSVIVSESGDYLDNGDISCQDGMINADKYSKYDPVQRLEDAYMKLVDTHNLNTNSLRADIDEIKSEIRKIPNKLHDNMKKDLQANTKALRELCAKIDQNDELKKQISCLTAQLKTSSKEIWSLQRELALVRSSAKRRPNQSPAPSSDIQSPGVWISDGTPSSEDSPVTTHANMERSVDRVECSPTASERSLLNAVTNLSPEESASSSPQAVNEGLGTAVAMPNAPRPSPARVQESIPLGTILQHLSSGQPSMEVDNHPPGDHRQVDNVTLQPAHRADPQVAPVHRPTPEIPPQVGAQTTIASTVESTDERERTTSPITTRFSDAEALLIGDSTTKYVAKERFMGRHMAQLQRASTSATARKTVDDWPASENMQYAVLHVGVNDVRDRVSTGRVIDNIKYVLNKMHAKFQNAKIAFTEILYVGEESSNPELNNEIKYINDSVENFCDENNFIYVKHKTLQKPDCALYDDNVHIDSSGGTASFVADIHRAVGLHSKPRLDTDPHMYRCQAPNNAERNRGRHGAAVSADSGATAGRASGPAARYKWEGRDQGPNVNLDQMLKLITINMLQSMQLNVWNIKAVAGIICVRACAYACMCVYILDVHVHMNACVYARICI